MHSRTRIWAAVAVAAACVLSFEPAAYAVQPLTAASSPVIGTVASVEVHRSGEGPILTDVVVLAGSGTARFTMAGGEIGDLGYWTEQYAPVSVGDAISVDLQRERDGDLAPRGAPLVLASPFGISAQAVTDYLYENKRWDYAALPVHWRFNSSGAPAGALSAVQAGADTWEDDEYSTMDFTFDGSTNAAPDMKDGINFVGWDNYSPSGELAHCAYWYNLTSGSLGYDKLIEFDINFNTYYSWSTQPGPSQMDIQSVALHEFGHTLSLRDLHDATPTSANQVMNGYTPFGNISMRTLRDGDFAGLRSIYPDGSSPTVDIVVATIDAISPNPATVGRPVTFTGHGQDSSGHAIKAWQWRSSIDGVLSSSASFTTSSLSAGTHTIHLSVKCASGEWSPEQRATLAVGEDPAAPYVTAAIDSVSPDPATVGTAVTFTGHASETHGYPVTEWQWRSSISGVLSTSASFSTSSLPIGTHTIYLKARCASGAWSPEQQVSLAVRYAPMSPGATVLELAPPSVVAFKSATLTCALKSSTGSPLSDRPIRLDSSADGVTWSQVATVSSEAGFFSARVAPEEATYYRLIFSGDSNHEGCTSPAVLVIPPARVGTPSSAASVRKGKPLAVTGTLSPRHQGEGVVTIYAYRYERGWKLKGTYSAKASVNGYVTSVRLKSTGKWRLRAYHPADTSNLAAWSAGYRTVTVK